MEVLAAVGLAGANQWLNEHVPDWFRGAPVSWCLVLGSLATFCYQVGVVALLWHVNTVDISLWGCRYSTGIDTGSVPCPGYFVKIGISNPEGWLWDVFNFATPATVQISNQLYALYSSAIFWFMMFRCLKSGRVPLRLVAWTSAVSLFFILGYGHEYQNLSIAALAPLVYVFPPFAAVLLLMKLPVGPWDMSPSGAMWQCALHCGGSYADPLNLLAHVSNWYALVLLSLLPLLFRRLDNPGWSVRKVVLGF